MPRHVAVQRDGCAPTRTALVLAHLLLISSTADDAARAIAAAAVRTSHETATWNCAMSWQARM